MKILIIDHYYPTYLDYLYTQNNNLVNLNYVDQKNYIFDQCFGTANFYSKNLNLLGHQAEEIILNNKILQRQWAKENNFIMHYNPFNKIPKIKNYTLNESEKILEAQIKKLQPDIIYCQNLNFPSQYFLHKIKKYSKLIIGQVACPITFNYSGLKQFDLILTSFPHYVERLKKIGIQSEYFKIGFEASIIDKLILSKNSHKAVFVGGFSKHHEEVMNTFEYLAKNLPIDFWGYGSEQLPEKSIIKEKHHGEAWGINMYNLLFNSKISINRHIDAAENYANNMRLYESTGVGTMLITDTKDNLGELFEIGREVESYRTKEELLEKVVYYLSHEEERKKIAKAGQARTLKDHTYEVRMKELVNIINKYL